MTSARVGHVVGGRYRLVAELGSGGFGRVWRARHETLDVDVAIKELRLQPGMSQAEQDDRLARATREARNAARLRQHENIVAIQDIFVEDGLPWIVMDLVDGSSLDDHVKANGPLSPDRVADIAGALLAAIGAAHDEGVVHRDVKPANVMLAKDGTVLLTDFGIAVHANDPGLTKTGMFIGSPEFTAPERLRGTDGLPASDLFSLGVTLYYAVEGVSPFHRASEAASFSAVLLDEPPEPQRAGQLTEFITRLLDKDPDQRPSVVEAVAMVDDQSTATTRTAKGRARRGTKVVTGRKPLDTRQVGQPGEPMTMWQLNGIAVMMAALAALAVIGLPTVGRAWEYFDEQFDGPAGAILGAAAILLSGLVGVGVVRAVPPGAGTTVAFLVGVLGFGFGGAVTGFAFDGATMIMINVFAGDPGTPSRTAKETTALTTLGLVGVLVLIMAGWAWELRKARRANAR